MFDITMNMAKSRRSIVILQNLQSVAFKKSWWIV